MQQQTYEAIGVMSGTSLDGLDLAYCRFTRLPNGVWKYELLAAESVPYSAAQKQQLDELHRKSALAYITADMELGIFIGEQVRAFAKQHKAAPLFVASHGHTIFHRPSIGFSAQIGHGPSMAAQCGLPVINDFRSADVALGGQGAPLVPIGDQRLFSDYDYCVNLGGIANISFDKEGRRLAFDVCGCNLLLNRLAQLLEHEYDPNGQFAKEGMLDQDLFDELNNQPYFEQPFPKSLDKEWLLKRFMPLLQGSETRVRDLLHTVCCHIAYQIAQAVNSASPSQQGKAGRMLLTGGGAFNKFLVEKINAYSPNINITVPDPQVVSFKEAIVFAFLGVLRWRQEPNALRSVTGAKRDSVGGAIHWLG